MKTLFDLELNQSGLNAKAKAQKALDGLTHYCDDNTLKGFNCKIVSCSVLDQGKMFGLVEHLPMYGFDAPKKYRCVFFSVDGMGIRSDLTYNTKAQAMKGFWNEANDLEADSIYKQALANMIRWREDQIKQIKEALTIA